MAVSIKHKFTSAIPDGADATQVRPSNWNDEHDASGLATTEDLTTHAGLSTGDVRHLTAAQINALHDQNASNSWAEQSRTYDGAVIGTDATLPEAIAALDDALTTVEYPLTAIGAGSWATLSGTVADTVVLGGSTMVFTEDGGANSFVQLNFDGVDSFNLIHIHYRYYSTSGTTGHATDLQIEHNTTGWESLGVATSANVTLLDLLNKEIENGADYISADANKRVRIRLFHTSNTSALHRFEVDHAIIVSGMTMAGAVTSHAGLGGRDLANQHPVSAITNLTETLATKGGKDEAQTWTKGQRGEVTPLTVAANAIAIDLADSNNFSVMLQAGGSQTLSAPTNAVAGQSGAITITQNGTPSTLAYDVFWDFTGTTPAVDATANSVSILYYYVYSSTKAHCSLVKVA